MSVVGHQPPSSKEASSTKDLSTPSEHLTYPQHPVYIYRASNSTFAGVNTRPSSSNQAPLSPICDPTNDNILEGSEETVKGLPVAQIAFLAQLAVIFVLDTFCLLKLSLTKTSSQRKTSFCDELHQECHETTIYMSILSSTLAFLIPPPRVPRENFFNNGKEATVEGLGKAKLGSVIVGELTDVAHSCQPALGNTDQSKLEADDVPDCVNHQSNSFGCQKPSFACNGKNWVFVNRPVDRGVFIFCSQTLIVFVLVLFSALRMLIASSLSCEEKTAYLMILSACIGYILPNADSFTQPARS